MNTPSVETLAVPVDDDPMLQLIPPRYVQTKIDPVTKRFLPGNVGGPGLPKGYVKAKKVYMTSAAKLARAYVKTAIKGNATLLKDAREWIMPVESDRVGETTNMVIFVGDGSLPRASDSV